MNLLRAHFGINGYQPSGPLLRVKIERFVDDERIPPVFGGVFLGENLFIEEGDFVTRGVVQTREELGSGRDNDAPLFERFPYLGVVGHVAERSGIHRSGAATACATVIGGIVRIVYAGCAVANHVNDGSKGFIYPV